MALNFPYPASPGDTYSNGGIIYTYDGVKWIGNIPATYGDSNVKNLLTSGDVTEIAVSGGISSEFFLGPLANGQSNVNIPDTDGNVEITVNGNIWSFNTNGNLAFPDNTEQHTAYPGHAVTLVSDNDPNVSNEGSVWYNSDLGRSFVKYNGQWVDMNPQTVPPDAANPFDQDLNTTDNVTFNNITGNNILVAEVATGTVASDFITAGTVTADTLQANFNLNANTITAGNVTANYFIGDGSQLSNIQFPEFDNHIFVSDIAPNITEDGKLWFNSTDGRTYVSYNEQWVDASPETVPNPDINVTSITFPDGSVQTKSSDLGNLAVGDYATLYDTNSQNNLNLNEGNLGDVSLRSFSNDVKITSDYINTSSTWQFRGDGNLVLPNGGAVGGVQVPDGVDLYANPTQRWVQLNYDNQSFVWAEEQIAGIQAGENAWVFVNDGRILFPDGTIQETAYPGETTAKVPVTDYPPSAEEGTVWFNTELGRAFVKYNGQWVDFSPQTVPPDAANPFDQDLNTTDNVTFNNINASNVQINDLDTTILAAGSANIASANIENITISNNLSINNISTGNVTANYFIGDGRYLSNLSIPDIDKTVLLSDNPPPLAAEGSVWFNTQQGRTFVKYDNQWVDSSPQIIDPTAVRTNDNDDIELTKNIIASTGRIYQDGIIGKTSMRWVNMTDTTSLMRVYRGPFNDGNEEDQRAELGIAYQAADTSGIYIISDDNGSQHRWTFDGTGNLVLPNGGKIGGIQYPSGSELYSNALGYAQLNYNNQNFVWVEETLAGIQTGNAQWNFTEDGNITFPDGTVQETAYTGQSNSSIVVSNTAPEANVDGKQWFNSADGRTYVAFNNQWVDASPQTIDARALRIDEDDYVATPNNRIVTDTINASMVSVDSVLYPDNTVQTTAYQGPATLLDGGGANSTYTGNIPPGGIPNPFNQELNTTDHVQFNSVTAGNFVGNLVGNVPVANVTGLGNIATINLTGSSSTVLYGNGVFAPATSTFSNTTTDNFFIDNENKGLVVDASGLKRFGFMKYSGIEGSLVHSTYTGAAVPLRIGRTNLANVTDATVNEFTTEIYIGTNGCVRIGDDTVNNINDPTNRLEVNGNIKTSTSVIFSDNTSQTTAYRPTTAPTTSKGSAGNKAGMVAFTNGFFFYCIADYTDGVADIWVRSAWDQTSWS